MSYLPNESDGPRTMQQAIWTNEHESTFIDIMVEHVNKGDMATSTFSRHVWKEIYAEFFEKTRKCYDPKQFRNKYNKLRQRYKNFKKLTEHTGVGWDPVTNNITADDYTWDNYLKVNQDANVFRMKGCPEYPRLCIIYGDTTTKGFNAWTTNQEPTPEPRVDLEDSDPEFVMETQNTTSQDFRGTERIPGYNRRRRNSRGDSIADAIREVAEVNREKFKKIEASSSRTASFSISVCMEEINKYDDIPMPKRLKATKELQDKTWRETFMAMKEEMRRAWMESFE